MIICAQFMNIMMHQQVENWVSDRWNLFGVWSITYFCTWYWGLLERLVLSIFFHLRFFLQWLPWCLELYDSYSCCLDAYNPLVQILSDAKEQQNIEMKKIIKNHKHNYRWHFIRFWKEDQDYLYFKCRLVKN